MRVKAQIKWLVGRGSRAKKLNHFYTLCSGGSILDAGVTGAARTPTANMFLETFRFSENDYTGLGVDDLSTLRARHPNKTFVEYDGIDFPFDDNSFDWVFSNAVIEHVGDRKRQLKFLSEMLRVGRNVFFTTPNKNFPVESHTNAVFMHWLPQKTFFQWCAKKGLDWNSENLNLLTRSDIESLLRASDANGYKVFSNRLAGWPMTFTIVCRDCSDVVAHPKVSSSSRDVSEPTTDNARAPA